MKKYFTEIQPGDSFTQGYIAFDLEVKKLVAADKANKSNKVDLDKKQIDDVLTDIIEAYVQPTIAKKNTPSKGSQNKP